MVVVESYGAFLELAESFFVGLEELGDGFEAVCEETCAARG